MKGFQLIDKISENDLIFCLKVKPPLISLRQTMVNFKIAKDLFESNSYLSIFKSIEYKNFNFEKKAVIPNIILGGMNLISIDKNNTKIIMLHWMDVKLPALVTNSLMPKILPIG